MTYSLKFKIIGIIFTIISMVGFIDATYLTVEHYKGSVPPCAIQGCEIVLTSGQSVIVGIPIALLGSIYYLIILILSIAFLESGKMLIIRFASHLTIAGIIASAYFVFLQFFVIKQICQYCMISAGTSTSLFFAGVYALRKIKKEKLNLL